MLRAALSSALFRSGLWGLAAILAGCAPSQSRDADRPEGTAGNQELASSVERVINGRWATDPSVCDAGGAMQAGVMSVLPQEIQVDLLRCHIAESARPGSLSWRFYGQCTDADGTAVVRDFELELVDPDQLRWNNPGEGRVQLYNRCTGGTPIE
ncbi:hypothetical protein [Maricaulis sp. CAU 1757]